jgi:hypothetical protein
MTDAADLLKKLQYALTKDSLTNAERVESALCVVLREQEKISITDDAQPTVGSIYDAVYRANGSTLNDGEAVREAIACKVASQPSPAATVETSQFETTKAGVIDWKMEAERANRLLAQAERPKCRLCGLEDGACICAHLPPRLSADSDLLPCPFCGGPPSKIMASISVMSDWQIRCDNDDCIGPHTTAHHEADATRQWNTRAQPQTVCTWPNCDQPSGHDFCYRHCLNDTGSPTVTRPHGKWDEGYDDGCGPDSQRAFDKWRAEGGK